MAGEVIREAVIKLKLETVRSKVEAPDYKKAIEANQDYSKSVGKTTRDIAEDFKDARDQVEKLNKAQQQSARDEEAAARKRSEALDVVGGGLARVGEGAVIAARGFAFFGINAEEGIGKTIATVAKLQGALDVVRGASQALENAKASMNALKVATNSATVAEAIHTTAINAKTKALAGAKAALIAVKTTLGPVGLAITAVTVVLGAAAAAWLYFRNRAKEATEIDLSGLEKQLALIKANTAAQLANSAEQVRAASALGSIRSRRLSLLSLEERSVALAKERKLLGKDFTGDRIATGEAESGSDFFRAKAAEARKIANQLEKAKKGSVIRQTEKGLESRRLAADFDLQNTTRIVDQQKRSLEIIRQRQQFLEREKALKTAILDKEQMALETRRQQLKTSRSLVRNERERLRSLDEQVGRLDAASRIELKTLIQRAKSGKITFDEVKKLEQLGGERVRKFTSQFFTESGRKFGGASIFDGLPGTQAPARGRGSELERLEAERDKTTGQLGNLGRAGSLLEEAKINFQLGTLQQKRKKADEESSRLLQQLIEIEDGAVRRSIFMEKILSQHQQKFAALDKELEKLHSENAS